VKYDETGNEYSGGACCLHVLDAIMKKVVNYFTETVICRVRDDGFGFGGRVAVHLTFLSFEKTNLNLRSQVLK
jgi:hypothetical protein